MRGVQLSPFEGTVLNFPWAWSGVSNGSPWVVVILPEAWVGIWTMNFCTNLRALNLGNDRTSDTYVYTYPGYVHCFTRALTQILSCCRLPPTFRGRVPLTAVIETFHGFHHWLKVTQQHPLCGLADGLQVHQVHL